MSMVIEEPTQKETFTQKKKREQREVRYLHSHCTFAPLPTTPADSQSLTSSLFICIF